MPIHAHVHVHVSCVLHALGTGPILTYVGVGHDDHDVSVGSEEVYKGSEAGIPYLHTLKLSLEFTVRGGGGRGEEGGGGGRREGVGRDGRKRARGVRGEGRRGRYG